MSFGEGFLMQPDLFPARPGGEPWGELDAAIAFAGGRYRVRGLAPEQMRRVGERFGALLDVTASAAGDETAIPLLVFRAPDAEFRRDQPRLWEVTFDLAHEAQSVRVAGRRFVARLDWRPRLVAALWTSVGDDDELPMVFENFFRLVVAYDLAERGGALLHSAAVEVDGGAYVFFGPSGAGKSTLAGLAEEAGLRVLSDDLNALSREDAGWRVEKVPFAGTLGGNAEVVPPRRLRALCRLRQTAAVGVAPESPGVALARLYAASPFVNADPFRGPALERSLLALAREQPVVALGFRRDSTFGEIADALALDAGRSR